MKKIKEIWKNLDLADIRLELHKNAHIRSDEYRKSAAKSKSINRMFLNAEIRE